MKPEELKEILNALKEHDKNMPTQKNMWENLQKILTTLSSVGVIWLVSEFFEMRESIYGINIKLENLEDFAQKPYFTLDDYNNKTQPLIQTINIHSNEIEKMERRLDEHQKSKEARHSTIDLKIQQLENDVEKLKR